MCVGPNRESRHTEISYIGYIDELPARIWPRDGEICHGGPRLKPGPDLQSNSSLCIKRHLNTHVLRICRKEVDMSRNGVGLGP